MIKLLKHLKWYEWLLLILTFAVIALQVGFNITIPEYTIKISAYLSPQNGPLANNWDRLVITCLKMLGFTFAVLGLAFVANFLASYIVNGLLARVRSRLFKRVNEFSSKEINKFSIPSLITRSTNDITQLEQVFTSLITMGLRAPLTAVMAITKIVDLAKRYNAGLLSVVNVVSVLMIILLVLSIMFLVVPKFKIMQKTTDNLNKVTRENLTGLKVVRANNAEKSQEDKFEQVNTRFAKLDWFVSRIMAATEPMMTLIMQGSSLAIVWVIGILAKTNPTIVELMIGFTQYSSSIIISFTSLSVLFMFVPRGIISANRINEVLDTPLSLVNGNISKTNEEGTIVFNNVSFRYPDADADVLENISFKVKKSQTVAFIGSTGSGKSTLINLIPRFYDCTEGEILIDGINIKDYDQSHLHNKIGYVPQKGILFSGTVLSNIKYGDENATIEDVTNAINISQSNFVYQFDKGIEHSIAQRGKNVSGGQKQRLSIARAIVKNPEILIFDDSFSALDFKTDKTVRKNLNKAFKNTTKIIVAQRIGTIMNADQIIVLNEGKMVGIGTHKQLLKECEIYKEIALSQLSKEELAK